MKQLSQLQSPEFAALFAIFDGTLLGMDNQDVLTAIQPYINQISFGPIYGVYRQEINPILFTPAELQLEADSVQPSFIAFCENGVALTLGSTIHLISWDSLAGHQPLPVNVDDNPTPTLMVRLYINNNEMIGSWIVPEPQIFLIIDTIMRGFAKINA